MRKALGKCLLAAALAGLVACGCEGPNGLPSLGEGGALRGAPPAEAPPPAPGPVTAEEPPAPADERPAAGGPVAGAEAAPLGLFAPVLPTLGVDTHSTNCDPFDDPYQVCL